MIRVFASLISLGLFATLASYSYGKLVTPESHPSAHRSAFNQFVDRQEAHYATHRSRERTVLVWTNRKAALIAEALSLTPENIDTTVDVRREP